MRTGLIKNNLLMKPTFREKISKTRKPLTLRIYLIALMTCLAGMIDAAYNATIQEIEFTGPDYILDADEDISAALWNRDRMRMSVRAQYTRLSSDPSTVAMRLAIRLLEGGVVVGQDNGSGGATLVTYLNFTLNYGASLSFPNTRNFSVKPAGALSLDKLYQVEVTIQVETSPGSGSYTNLGTGVSATRRIWHFTGKQESGPQRNVLARIRQITFLKPYAIQTGSTERERAFIATAELEIRRYDGWLAETPNTNQIEFRVGGDLYDSTPTTVGVPGTLMPLANPARWEGTLPVPQFTREPEFNLPVPAVEVFEVDVFITPDGQLPTVSETFTFIADLQHIAVANSGIYVTNQTGMGSAYTGLQHYHGDLIAPGTLATVLMRNFLSNPGPATRGASFWTATIGLTEGELKLNPNWQLLGVSHGLSGIYLLDVRLFEDGRAELQSGEVWIGVPEGLERVGAGNNLFIERENVTFSTAGITADVSLILPHGMGVREEGSISSSGFLSGRLVRPQHPLVPGFLLPQGPVVFEPQVFSHFVISEETKPFTIQAQSITWAIAAGTLTPGPAPVGVDRVRYVRAAEAVALEASPLPAADKVTRSNEAYFRRLDGSALANPVFRAGADGSALFSGTVTLLNGFFRAHFPYDVRLQWNASSTITFVDDLPQTGGSALQNPAATSISYMRDCVGFEDCGTIGMREVALSPSSPSITFTADGGLLLPVTITGNGALQIGYIHELTTNPSQPVFAHRTTAFSNGSLLLGGHFASGQNGAGVASPEALLNSGFSSATPGTPERPGTAGYAQGGADYPGLNVRVSDQPGSINAISVLGGVQTPSYTMGNRSKYYVRRSGVTGIHDPASNPFPDPVLIYGYLFEFSNFALSFKSSEIRESRTIGSLYIPDPAASANGFTCDFNPLFFSCIGSLTTAELANGPFDHTLGYWNADITALAAAFEPKAGAVCNPGAAFFALGVEGHASHIAQPLLGTLVFAPNGDLVPSGDPQAPAGRDSRLYGPTTLAIAGPTNETYHLMPLHGAYLNRHAEAESSFNGTAQGFMNIAGLLDVAFFRDLKIHLQTGARKGNTTDPLHFMGGWQDGGTSFFDSAAFDTGNRAFPPAASLAGYRAGDSASWRVRAQQEWLDVIKFDYELAWQSAAKVFRSRAPIRNDLLVLTTENKLKRLSPQVAEIDFGASLDIEIPSFNLEGLAQSTPLYAALNNAADTVTEKLLEGLDASERLLNDLADRFFDEVFAAVLDPLTDSIAAAIANAASQLELDGILDNGFDALETAFKSANGVADAVAEQVGNELQQMQDAIDAVAGPDGYFQNSGTAENPRYDVATNVVIDVFTSSDLPFAAGVAASVGAAALDEIVADSMAERSETIEQVRSTMEAIDSAIDIILTEGGLEAELVEIFTGSAGTIEDFLDAARSLIEAALDPDTLGQWAGDELNRLVRQAIRDQFNASALFGQFHAVVRGYVYELDAAMRSAIDSVFAEINQVIMDIVDDFLPVDGPLREFLGDIAGSYAHGKLDGYARINGDALRTLRLDGEFETNFPDPFAFNGYIEINQLKSGDTGPTACFLSSPGDVVTEVRLGAENVKVGWRGDELRFNIDTKFSFNPSEATRLVGLAGAFEMTSGEIRFEAFQIDDFAAGAAYSLTEAYLAARVGLLFNGDRMLGGIFLGKTCNLAPIEAIDPDVARALPTPNPTFTGIYAYGQAFIPIVNVGCLFNLSASAGAGIFVFHEDQTFGGKMLVGASARALCAVNVGGELSLVGVKAGNQFNFSGAGRIFGSAGKKPLRVEFDKRVSLTYKNSKWSYDY